MKVKENLEEILEDIKKYSPYPEQVKLVAVTKYISKENMEEFLNNNYKIFGENKAQIMKEKVDYLNGKTSEIEWHFIGNLQKNKVKYIIEDVKLIHSINKLSLAQEVDKRAKQKNKVVDVLLEINIYGEESKQGYSIDELKKDIEELKKLKNLNIVGLMTMGPLEVDENITRSVFSKLVKIKKELNEKYFNNSLKELSMGMSEDYKIALEEGSTIIRIGSRLIK